MPQPHARRRQVDLATLHWQFGSVPQRPWPISRTDAAPMDIDRVGAWLPGTVPGTVQSDLLFNGRIPDPFVDDQASACQWVETHDWWYRAALSLQLGPGDRAFLEFDGIDTLSAVFVDGVELSRHEGMFSRLVVEVPSGLAGRPAVELAIRLWGSAALPRYETTASERAWGRIAGLVQKGFRPFDDRLATLKAPMHAGWDFAPRLRTMGLWNDARLVVCRAVYLADLWVEAEPTSVAVDPGPARATVRLTIESDTPRSLIGLAEVRPAMFTGKEAARFGFVCNTPLGLSQHTVELDLPALRLWHPWERGEPFLYELTVSLYEKDAGGSQDANSSVLDMRSARFGVRTVECRDTESGDPWRVIANGEPLFLRGANWVPIDALWGRARRAHYEPLLQQARLAGVNFVRVWGGGGSEKQAFYDLCDELGLLVWQEFPIACVFLDRLPRSERFQRLLRQEATGIVQALRSHPSLFLWCGGNEFSPSRNAQAVAVIGQVVAAEDGTRPFVKASPGPGDAHQWQVWHGSAPLAAYRDERAAFVSEFGLQAAPQVSSLRRFLPEASLWPPGAGWQMHKAELSKLWRYARWFGGESGDITANGTANGGRDGAQNEEIEAERRNAGRAWSDADLERFVAATQRAQAAGIQVLVEQMRRRKGQTGGVAVWQWNEPWPAISWSVVDYYGVPKAAYNTLLHIFQPVLVSLEYPLRAYRPGDLLGGMLWIVNDRLDDLVGCQAVAWLDGKKVHGGDCTAPANASRAVGKLAIRLPERFAELRLELWHGNSVIAANVYDLRFHDPSPQRLDQLARRRLVDLVLQGIRIDKR